MTRTHDLLTPRPTVPWRYVSPEDRYAAPVEAMTSRIDNRRAVSFLCQIPGNRFATLVWSNIPGNRSDTLGFLDGITDAHRASLEHQERFLKWTALMNLPIPERADEPALDKLTQELLEQGPLAESWRNWANFHREKYLAPNGKPLSLETAETPVLVNLVASTLYVKEPLATSSGTFHRIREGFVYRHVGASGSLPSMQKREALAQLLALLCETLQDGERDLARYLKLYPGSPAHAFADLLQRLPAEEVLRRQVHVDLLLQTAHTSKARSRLCGTTVSYRGNLPTRYPLACFLEDLLQPYLDKFLEWAARPA